MLVAVAPFAATPTTITNITENTKHIKTMRAALEKLAIKIEAGNDWLKIFPSLPQAATITCENNPRLAIMLMLISLRVPGIKILGADSVKQICSQFFEAFYR